MKTHNLALLAALAAFGWSGAVQAQPGYPPPPPPNSGYGQPPYDQPGYNNPPYGQQGYNNPPYDQQGNPDDPYYDDQGPDNGYDQGPGPYDPGYDQGYGQPGYSNQGPVDVSIFYSNLHPYGRWLQRGGYGWVWEPTVVRVGWRPYTVGRWVDTDYGWTWVSDEPWGWATYHYGRWLSDPEYGWLWVPGTEWGPAWCSFQEGNGYIGWAPLPPTVGFRAGIGIQIGALSFSASFTPYAYSFVPARSFLETRVDRLILPPARNVTLIRTTRNITNITVVNNRIINRSVPVERVEQWTGQRVQQFRVADVRNPAQAPRRGSEIQGDQVRIFRPAPTLAPARPAETPQAVINRRAYRPAPGQPGQPQPQPVPGQAPEGRWRQQPPPQPGQAQPQPQPVPGQGPQSRWLRQPPTPQDLDRKHQAEEQRLQSQQAEERNRLQQIQTQERQSQRDRSRAQQLDAQHQAEMKAMQEQQQREQQVQRAREQREKQAVESRRNQGPPPGQDRRNQGGQGQGNQGQGKGQDKGQERNRDRRQQPPPPPPPGR